MIVAGLEAILGSLGENLGAFGPILARLGRPRGSTRGPRRGPNGAPKSVQKYFNFLIDFWMDFGATQEGQGGEIAMEESCVCPNAPGPGTQVYVYIYIYMYIYIYIYIHVYIYIYICFFLEGGTMSPLFRSN